MFRETLNTSNHSRGSRVGSYQHGSSYPYQIKEISADRFLINEIDRIPVPSDAGQSSPVSIQGVEAVASYSWLAATTATIAVPGSPPVWLGRTLPYIIPRDTRVYFNGQNTAQLSTSSLLPLIVAVDQYAPEFSLPSIDFVTDQTGLRKLYRWASRDPKAGTFRIDLDAVGHKTILMTRCGAEYAEPGYEFGFETASTTPQVGCETAIRHHRIITYDLGGLKMLVRFECDACLQSQITPGSELGSELAKNEGLDGLAEVLQKLTVSESSNTTTTTPTCDVASLTIYVRRGALVPQSHLLELKTCPEESAHGFDWDDTYSQLMLSQMPNIFLGVYQRREFCEVRERTLAELGTKSMERKAQESLRRLRNVLRRLKNMIMFEEKGNFSLTCKPGADMIVFERSTGTLLPKEILEKFK